MYTIAFGGDGFTSNMEAKYCKRYFHYCDVMILPSSMMNIVVGYEIGLDSFINCIEFGSKLVFFIHGVKKFISVRRTSLQRILLQLLAFANGLIMCISDSL